MEQRSILAGIVIGGISALFLLDSVLMGPRVFKPNGRLRGGYGEDLKPSDVDQEQLRMGAGVEMEHIDKNPYLTDSEKKKISISIALDHLDEIPDYYDRLEEMEEEAGVIEEVEEYDGVKMAKGVLDEEDIYKAENYGQYGSWIQLPDDAVGKKFVTRFVDDGKQIRMAAERAMKSRKNITFEQALELVKKQISKERVVKLTPSGDAGIMWGNKWFIRRLIEAVPATSEYVVEIDEYYDEWRGNTLKMPIDFQGEAFRIDYYDPLDKQISLGRMMNKGISEEKAEGMIDLTLKKPHFVQGLKTQSQLNLPYYMSGLKIKLLPPDKDTTGEGYTLITGRSISLPYEYSNKKFMLSVHPDNRKAAVKAVGGPIPLERWERYIRQPAAKGRVSTILMPEWTKNMWIKVVEYTGLGSIDYMIAGGNHVRLPDDLLGEELIAVPYSDKEWERLMKVLIDKGDSDDVAKNKVSKMATKKRLVKPLSGGGLAIAVPSWTNGTRFRLLSYKEKEQPEEVKTDYALEEPYFERSPLGEKLNFYILCYGRELIGVLSPLGKVEFREIAEQLVDSPIPLGGQAGLNIVENVFSGRAKNFPRKGWQVVRKTPKYTTYVFNLKMHTAIFNMGDAGMSFEERMEYLISVFGDAVVMQDAANISPIRKRPKPEKEQQSFVVGIEKPDVVVEREEEELPEDYTIPDFVDEEILDDEWNIVDDDVDKGIQEFIERSDFYDIDEPIREEPTVNIPEPEPVVKEIPKPVVERPKPMIAPPQKRKKPKRKNLPKTVDIQGASFKVPEKCSHKCYVELPGEFIGKEVYVVPKTHGDAFMMLDNIIMKKQETNRVYNHLKREFQMKRKIGKHGSKGRLMLDKSFRGVTIQLSTFLPTPEWLHEAVQAYISGRSEW